MGLCSWFADIMTAEVAKINAHVSADDCFCLTVIKLISAAELMRSQFL